jgi:hypothetical protein
MRPQPQQLSMHLSYSAGPGQNPGPAVCIDVWQVATAGALSMIANAETVASRFNCLDAGIFAPCATEALQFARKPLCGCTTLILYKKAVLAAADSAALDPPLFFGVVRMCCITCNFYFTDTVAAVQRRIARSPVRLRHRMRVVVHSRKLQRNGHVFMTYTSPRYALHLCA